MQLSPEHLKLLSEPDEGKAKRRGGKIDTKSLDEALKGTDSKDSNNKDQVKETTQMVAEKTGLLVQIAAGKSLRPVEKKPEVKADTTPANPLKDAMQARR